jgi:protein-tyrosine phosphatase
VSASNVVKDFVVKPFNFIVPNIAQGSYPGLKGKAFDHADILVLCAEEFQAKNLKAPAGKAIVRLGFDDDIYRPIPPEAGKIFHEHAKHLGAAALAGRRIMITCAMGLNRSGLMTALTLMHGYRMSANDAINLIRARRDKECLCNPMFEQWLRSHDRRR